MGRRTFAVAVALITLIAFTASTVEARNGRGKRNDNCKQIQNVGKAGCPFGNTPGKGLAKGHGPGDGTGPQCTQPRDGTGFGAQRQGKGKLNNPNCDGTGPTGNTRGRSTVKP